MELLLKVIIVSALTIAYIIFGIGLIVHEVSHMIALRITSPQAHCTTIIVFNGKRARTYSDVYPCLIYYKKWGWIRFNGSAGLAGEALVGLFCIFCLHLLGLIPFLYVIVRVICILVCGDEYSDHQAICDPTNWKYKPYTPGK